MYGVNLEAITYVVMPGNRRMAGTLKVDVANGTISIEIAAGKTPCEYILENILRGLDYEIQFVPVAAIPAERKMCDD